MDPQQLSTKDTLTALDIPWSNELAQSTIGIAGSDICRHVNRFFTLSMARDFWLKWNSQQSQRIEDTRFLGHFWKFLVDGLELGYRLDRFREVSSRLPDPDGGAKNWIPFFEEAIASDDCCTVRLFLGREQHQTFQSSNPDSSGKVETLEQMLSMIYDELFFELGLVFRPITIAVDDTLASPWFRCEWNDLRLPPQCGIDVQKLLVNDTVDRLTLLNIKGEKTVNPANGAEWAIIDSSYKSIAESAGLTTWDSQGYALLAMYTAFRQAGAALINRPLYQLYILRLREVCPDLVSIVEGAMPQDFVIQILRGLLAEEISIRHMSTILEAALELRSTINVDMNKYIVFFPPTSGVLTDSSNRHVSKLLPSDYVDFIRAARLKRYISNKYARGGNNLVVYLMDPNYEDLIVNSNEINEATESTILKSIREEIGSLPFAEQSPVILTTMGVRRKLRRLVSLEFPRLVVLSYQELSPELNIQPIGRITISG